MENIYLNIFLSGLLILIFAVFINFLAGSLGLITWHSFLKSIQINGILETIKNTGFLSYLFLFIIYPFCLGVIVFFASSYLIRN